MTQRTQHFDAQRGLLAIDLGIRAGFAYFAADGSLQWFRSRNAGSAVRFRALVRHELRGCGSLSHVVMEGGGPLADAVEKAARGFDALAIERIAAEQWRATMLPRVNFDDGKNAKAAAIAAARDEIVRAGISAPKSLRHDAAEAILIGVWAVRRLGWD